MLKALDVARWIISFCAEHGDPVTNLKLQKLLYYAQAWHLALFDKPLFEEEIEAWVYGPVVPEVYRAFRHFGAMTIQDVCAADTLSPDADAYLKEVLEVFGGYSSYQLERMAHQEDPWRNARGNLSPEEPCSNAISHEDMTRYYRQLAAQSG